VRIFGLTPGRTGSVTFTLACRQATNVTSGHETRAMVTPLADRLRCPDQHVEADRHLSLMLGALGATYREDVLFVHLWSEPESTARSWVRRMPDVESWPRWIRVETGTLVRRRHRQTLASFIGHTLFGPARRLTEQEQIDAARAYVDMTNANITEFLTTRPSVVLDVDQPHALAEVWERGGVAGDFDAAIAQYDTRWNASRSTS
jgi:hypothetical protein